MKKTYTSAFVAILIFICSCAPKTIVSDMSLTADPGEKLFSKAEKNFQGGKYEKALELYLDYLTLYPAASLAPAALLKAGEIYSINGNYSGARECYMRLVKEHPDSFLVPDGLIEILVTYYDEGRYEDVIRHASTLDEKMISEALFIRKCVVVGDAYLAMGASRDAFNTFITAYFKSGSQDRKSLIVKLKETMELLSPEEIISILAAIKDALLRDSLTYQLGINYAKAEQYEKALEIFSGYIREFPVHEHTAEAKQKIEEIYKKTFYDRYTVGCLLPLSGRYKTFGNRALRGIELAFSQFSMQGANPSIRIIVRDTGGDPEQTLLAVRELADMNVAAIIGPMIAVEPAVMEAQDRRIPIITLTQKEHITQTGDYIFRNFLTPEIQAKTIVAYAVEALGLKRFAVLYPDEKYGKTFLNLFWDEVIKYGGEIVGVESYDADHTDFAGPIKKLAGLYYDVPEDLKETENRFIDDAADEHDLDITAGADLTDDITESDISGPTADENPEMIPEAELMDSDDEENKRQAIVDFDVVFIPDGPEKVGLILPQLAYYDIKDVHLLGTNLWYSPKLVEMAKLYAQGAIIPEAFFPESRSKNVKHFVNVFSTVFGEKPGFIDAVSYDTAMMLFGIISRNDVRFQASIKNELMAMQDFQSVTGLTSFDHDREAIRELTLLKVAGERFIELNRN